MNTNVKNTGKRVREKNIHKCEWTLVLVEELKGCVWSPCVTKMSTCTQRSALSHKGKLALDILRYAEYPL